MVVVLCAERDTVGECEQPELSSRCRMAYLPGIRPAWHKIPALIDFVAPGPPLELGARRRVELRNDVGRNPAAVTDLYPVALGPCADGC
jgi:hypothetical protein